MTATAGSTKTRPLTASNRAATARDRLLHEQETAARVLQSYADRGVFRGFSRAAAQNGRAVYRVVSHRDRMLEFIVDLRGQTIRCPLLLPQVPPDSTMYRSLLDFIRSRQDEDLAEHRRIDRRKARVRCANRGGNVALSLAVLDGDWEYAVRKFVHLANEIFLAFIGDYFDYQVEILGVDPDHL